MKRAHELWIEERLGCILDEQMLVYQDFIDRVALALDLENWEWICDCLFRQIMPVEFPNGIYQLGFEYFRAVFPGQNIEFEDKLKKRLFFSFAGIPDVV